MKQVLPPSELFAIYGDFKVWFIRILSLIIILLAFRSHSHRVTSSMNEPMAGPIFVRVAK